MQRAPPTHTLPPAEPSLLRCGPLLPRRTLPAAACHWPRTPLRKNAWTTATTKAIALRPTTTHHCAWMHAKGCHCWAAAARQTLRVTQSPAQVVLLRPTGSVQQGRFTEYAESVLCAQQCERLVNYSPVGLCQLVLSVAANTHA